MMKQHEWFGQGYAWLIKPIDSRCFYVSKCNSFSGTSYTEPPKDIHHPRKVLTDIQNVVLNNILDGFLIRFLNSEGKTSAKTITCNKNVSYAT